MNRELLQQAYTTLSHARNFIVSKERMHPTGVDLYDKLVYEICDELAKQDFYPDWDMIKPFHDRIKELEEQLAKPEQEPVAWLPKWAHDRLTGQLGSVSDPVTWGINTHIYAKSTPETIPLYTTPPRKPWVGLTDEDIERGYETTGHYQTLRPQDRFAVFALARAIQAKLKEKNT